MPDLSDPTLVRELRSASPLAGAGAALIGLTGIVGWICDSAFLKTIPGLVSVKPNTAACFLLAGGALCFSMQGQETQAKNRISQLAGMVIFIVGLLTLIEKLSGRDLGIDQFLFRDLQATSGSPSGQMAANTASCFTLLGVAIPFLGTRIRNLRNAVQFLAVTAALVTFVAITSDSPMAMHTCLGFLLLCSAILCYRPADGVMAEVTSSDAGGKLIRRLLLPAILLPLLLGFVHALAPRASLYGNDWEFILQAVANIALFAILVWWCGKRLRNQAEQLAQSELSLREQTVLTQSIFSSMGEGLAVADEDGKLIRWNPAAEKCLGDLCRTEKDEAGDRHGSFQGDGVTPYPAHDLPLVKAIRGEATDEVEIFLQTPAFPTGAWFRFTGRPLRDRNGELRGGLVLFRDVTKLKQAEAELLRADTGREAFVKELKRRNLEITLLGRMGDLLQSCLKVEEACTVIGDFAQLLFPSASGTLYLLDASRRNLHQRAHWGAAPLGAAIFPPEQCWALRRGKIYSAEEGSRGLVCEHLNSAASDGAICLPMAAQGDVLGVVSVRGKIYEQLSNTFVEQIALAVANLKMREILRNQSIRDPLTGLFNRRYMEESLDRELKKSTRNGRPLGAILIDVDHFKDFNDAFGHEVGDAVLKQVGAFLLGNTRGEDIACRYGGEEFAVIMPETSLDITVQRAGQLREKMKLLDLKDCGIGSKTITISLGVAAVPDHGSSIANLLKVADTALYKAKADGRDRVVAGMLPPLES